MNNCRISGPERLQEVQQASKGERYLWSVLLCLKEVIGLYIFDNESFTGGSYKTSLP